MSQNEKKQAKKEADKPLDVIPPSFPDTDIQTLIITRPLTPDTGTYAQLGVHIPIVEKQEKGKEKEKKQA